MQDKLVPLSGKRLCHITAGFSCAYFISALLGQWLFYTPPYFSTFWPASGVFFAGLLLVPTWWWPFICLSAAIAHFVVEMLMGHSLVMGGCFFLGNSMEAVVGACLVRRLINECPTLSSLNELFGITIFSAILSTTLSACTGALTIPHFFYGDIFMLHWLIWWMGNALGILVAAPLLLTWDKRGLREFAELPWDRVVEAILLLGSLAVCTLLVFMEVRPGFPSLKHLPIIFLCWGALRFGPRGAAASNCVFVLITIWCAGRGLGEFVDNHLPSHQQLMLLQFYLLVVVFATLALAVIFSERQQVENLLRASEERLRQVTDNMLEVLCQVDLAGVRRYVSPSHKSLLGYNPEELLDKSVLEIIHPEEKEKVRLALEDELVTGKPGKYLCRLRHKNDHYLWLECLSTPIFNVQGFPAGVVITGRDITERLQAEEEHRQLEEQVRQAQKLESLGVLAGGIAHDFNNLLTGIIGNAGLLMVDLAQNSPLRAYVKDIELAGLRAAELAQKMLAFSGQGRFVVETVNINNLLGDMAQSLSATVAGRATIMYNLAADLPEIEADVAQICQVIATLVTNALEALNESTGVIIIATSARFYDLAHLRDTYLKEDLPEKTYVRLSVSDNGCGMDEATLTRIFDPFFTTKFMGRGLGLPATLGIVRGHQGAFKVSSQLGQGTTIEVLLPAVTQVVTAAPEETFTYKGAGMVLVVDDEDQVRDVAQRMLELSGFSVLTAMDGEEAVEIFKQHRGEICLVLLDLSMPVMDGQATFQALKQIKPDVKVLLSSGYTEREVNLRFKGQGLAGFVQKPYQMASLLAKVKSVLRDLPVDSQPHPVNMFP